MVGKVSVNPAPDMGECSHETLSIATELEVKKGSYLSILASAKAPTPSAKDKLQVMTFANCAAYRASSSLFDCHHSMSCRLQAYSLALVSASTGQTGIAQLLILCR